VKNAMRKLWSKKVTSVGRELQSSCRTWCSFCHSGKGYFIFQQLHLYYHSFWVV
jgi:hypothetical protein